MKPDFARKKSETTVFIPQTRKPVEAVKLSKLETLSCGVGTLEKDSDKAIESSKIEIIPPPNVRGDRC